MARKPYSTDLNDKEWEMIKHLLPKPATWGGRHRKHDLREIMNAIFYVTRNGNNWADIPHDFPPKSTVFNWFSKWSEDGTIEAINNHLNKKIRQKAGREDEPTLGIIDSRSTKIIDKKKL